MLDFEQYASAVIIKQHSTTTKQNNKEGMQIDGTKQTQISIHVMADT